LAQQNVYMLRYKLYLQQYYRYLTVANLVTMYNQTQLYKRSVGKDYLVIKSECYISYMVKNLCPEVTKFACSLNFIKK